MLQELGRGTHSVNLARRYSLSAHGEPIIDKKYEL